MHRGVRVADFGLTRDTYNTGSYTGSTERPLPIKWMAIECLKSDKKFTTKSDVVGIIYALPKTKPSFSKV